VVKEFAVMAIRIFASIPRSSYELFHTSPIFVFLLCPGAVSFIVGGGLDDSQRLREIAGVALASFSGAGRIRSALLPPYEVLHIRAAFFGATWSMLGPKKKNRIEEALRRKRARPNALPFPPRRDSNLKWTYVLSSSVGAHF
jgi:hypothetical protein